MILSIISGNGLIDGIILLLVGLGIILYSIVNADKIRDENSVFQPLMSRIGAGLILIIGGVALIYKYCFNMD